MELCPLCNAISDIDVSCPKCGAAMNDGGIPVGYYEPYSPYLPYNILSQNDGVSKDECIHLFYCPSCGYDHRYVVNLIEI
jgi:hypothetical protein